MRGREQIIAIVAAHAALTGEVVRAAQLVAARGYGAFAAHLDQHRAELNVVIGEFAVWAESFGDWAKVDASLAIYPPISAASSDPAVEEDGLRQARDALRSARTDVLATLAGAREALQAAGLEINQLTTYRRLVRLWAGEAVDLVTEVHRLAVADRYLRRLGQVCEGSDAEVRRTGAAVLQQWMQELQEADREGELAFAEACGYGHLVEWYRSL
ncbi:MAG: hypothetical protein JO280_01330 [Mycobacteriaceae bacterium]|nr:hypothetical protein [Mycobacteriaceae bacterium]